MDLEDIILSEISQSQRDKYCKIPLIYKFSKIVKLIETERRMVVSRGWGEEGWGGVA